MEAAQFIDSMLWDMHTGFRTEVEPLSDDQLLHQPKEGANTIAFLLWHATLFEDQQLHRLAASTEPLWESERWFERLGLEQSDLGTGFTDEQVVAFRPDRGELMAYCERIWEVSPSLVARLTPERLDEALDPERPRMTVGRSISNFVLGHGFWHLGDIRYTKGLMGMPFSR
ncbi:MAG: DinB family protein [Dehalococcoidia bacterium]|nr:DinB family protein [Dehalococcoidia bacterium]